MKTERRHELQTNVLASSLGHWVKVAQPYSRVGLAVVILLVVALFAWAYLSTQNTRRVATGWNEYLDALNGRDPDPRDQLRDISGRYSGTMVGRWARLTLADLQLDAGTNRLLQDRKAARDELRDAREEFKALLLEASHETILQRATYGLALAHEALGELDEARKRYRELAEKWPKGPFAAAAAARADDLDELATKNFYDWFAKYEPPSLATEPGTPGARPDFLTEPDAGGMLKLPSATKPALPSLTDEPVGPELTSDANPEPAGVDESSEAPAETPTEPPAEESPAEESPESDSGPKLK
jgi:predicted negative regulator of RcsB-dependent stress response